MTLIEIINKNIEYIQEKDPYNVNALQSLQYLKEQVKIRTCNNCKYWKSRRSDTFAGYCERGDFGCDFGCNQWEGEDV